MNYELNYDEEKNLIIGRINGEFDISTVKEMAKQTGKMIERTGCKKLINDLREANFKASTLEIYSLPNIVNSMGVPQGCKRAILVNNDFSDARFFEDVFFNTGNYLKIFKDYEQAIKWLFDS